MGISIHNCGKGSCTTATAIRSPLLPRIYNIKATHVGGDSTAEWKLTCHSPAIRNDMSTTAIAAPTMSSTPAPAPLSKPVVFATSGLGGMLGWVLVHVSEAEKQFFHMPKCHLASFPPLFRFPSSPFLTHAYIFTACKHNCCPYESCKFARQKVLFWRYDS